MAQTCFEDEPNCTCRIHLRWLFLAMATRHCLTNCQQRPSPEGHGRNHVLEPLVSSLQRWFQVGRWTCAPLIATQHVA